MNNERIGKMTVTAIVNIIFAISAVVTEFTKGIKKDVERTEKENRYPLR